MVQQIIKPTHSVLELNYTHRARLLSRINASMIHRCLEDKSLQSLHFQYEPMKYKEILCHKCFKIITPQQVIFRKYGHPSRLRRSKYMHLECAEKFNYA